MSVGSEMLPWADRRLGVPHRRSTCWSTEVVERKQFDEFDVCSSFELGGRI